MDRRGEHVCARSQALLHRARHRPCRFTGIFFVACKKPGENQFMNSSGRTKRSAYMEWAKTRSHARFNLATSGLLNVPFPEFPLRLKDLEITAPAGNGYARLLHRLPLNAAGRGDGGEPAPATSLPTTWRWLAVFDPAMKGLW